MANTPTQRSTWNSNYRQKDGTRKHSGMLDRVRGLLSRPNVPASVKPSRCANALSRVAADFPKHSDKIELISRLVMYEDGFPAIEELATVKQRDFESLDREKNNSAKKAKEFEGMSRTERARADQAEAHNRAMQAELRSLGSAISTLAETGSRETNPIVWGQSVDRVSKSMPAVLGILERDGSLGALLPSESSPDACTLHKVATHDDAGGFPIQATYFVTSKEERRRGGARQSEDRIGFRSHPGGYRAIALDGVGGSFHPRQLVREIGERALQSEDLVASVRESLELVGKGMADGEVQVDSNEKVAFFQRERMTDGAACVLAAVDYDSKGRRATVHQIGDTVAFVEAPAGKWNVLPEGLSDGEQFDSRPQQLNCMTPEDAAGIETKTLRNATGRVALATDGVAEHILRNGGIEPFLSRIREHSEKARGDSLLEELEKEGIADDDLSFLLIEPN